MSTGRPYRAVSSSSASSRERVDVDRPDAVGDARQLVVCLAVAVEDEINGAKPAISARSI
jgi:hypothetical protein